MKIKEKMNKNAPENVENIENTASEEFPSELREPRWSVVSFEKCEAKNLCYAEAEIKFDELNRKKVSGLCIITDEAAARI